MAKDTKVIIVTDYAGQLHITPAANKSYYLQRNNLMRNKPQQYKVSDVMNESDAIAYVEKNNGMDPNFVPANQAQETITTQAKQIEELKAQLAQLEQAKKAAAPEKKSSKQQDEAAA